MQISKILIDFINDKENKELLNQFKFKELYEKLTKLKHGIHTSEFTAIMHKAKIDPLLYLNKVPSSFLSNDISVKNVDIPTNITSIDSFAFSSCSSLTSITIPDSVTYIGQGAFNNCYKLTSIVIPNNVTSIGMSAFWGCSSLKSITIGNNVVSIGNSAFCNCDELNVITYRGTKKQWNAIHKAENWRDGSVIKIIHCTDGDIKAK